MIPEKTLCLQTCTNHMKGMWFPGMYPPFYLPCRRHREALKQRRTRSMSQLEAGVFGHSPSKLGADLGSVRKTFFWHARLRQRGGRTGAAEFQEESCGVGERAWTQVCTAAWLLRLRRLSTGCPAERGGDASLSTSPLWRKLALFTVAVLVERPLFIFI